MVKSFRNFIINIIPLEIKYYLKKLKVLYMKFKFRVFSSSKILSSIYYFFSNSFNREFQGVLYGKYKYFTGEYGKEVLLRRNIHRLEKGLIMRPRRKVFARSYILETVKAYKSLLIRYQDESNYSGEIQWTHDVLEEYFSVVGEDMAINKARKIYQSINNDVIPNRDYKPYRRLITDNHVGYEDFLGLSKQRRAVRWYEDKKVPRELIDKAITVAALSPSACNRQPFEFKIFDEPELIEKVASVPMGTSGFSHQFPMIVVLVGKLDAYFDERDRHVIYIDASLAAMSFMYALETLGLSSCPINWPDIKKRENLLSNLLQLEPSDRAIIFISVGYPDNKALIPFSHKKSLDKIRSYN